MAAVVRVKRRVDEDPLEAFVLNSKRRKAETHTDKEEVSTILKFAGTVQNQVTACLQQQFSGLSRYIVQGLSRLFCFTNPHALQLCRLKASAKPQNSPKMRPGR